MSSYCCPQVASIAPVYFFDLPLFLRFVPQKAMMHRLCAAGCYDLSIASQCFLFQRVAFCPFSAASFASGASVEQMMSFSFWRVGPLSLTERISVPPPTSASSPQSASVPPDHRTQSIGAFSRSHYPHWDRSGSLILPQILWSMVEMDLKDHRRSSLFLCYGPLNLADRRTSLLFPAFSIISSIPFCWSKQTIEEMNVTVAFHSLPSPVSSRGSTSNYSLRQLAPAQKFGLGIMFLLFSCYLLLFDFLVSLSFFHLTLLLRSGRLTFFQLVPPLLFPNSSLSIAFFAAVNSSCARPFRSYLQNLLRSICSSPRFSTHYRFASRPPFHHGLFSPQ